MAALNAHWIAALAGPLSMTVALVLAQAALVKAKRRERMHKVMQEFVGVSPGWAPAAYAAAVTIELAACAALIWSPTRQTGAAVAAALWAIYTGLLLRAVLAGRGQVDCGCDAALPGRQLDVMYVVRAALLMLSAALVACSPPAVGALHHLLDLFAGGTLFVLYSAWNQLVSRSHPLESWQ